MNRAVRQGDRGAPHRVRLWTAVALAAVALTASVEAARQPPAALYRAGYELAPDLTRIWVNFTRAPWSTLPRPTLQDGAIAVFFPGMDLHGDLENLSLPGDNLVREVRFSRVPGGAVMRVLCQPGTTVKVKSASENDAYFLEIERPAALRPAPEIQPEELARLKEQGVKIVVLDPGHGGRDPGTHGHGMIEKEEVLPLARLIQAKINQMGQGRVRAFLTRTGDYNLGSLHDDSLQLRLKRAAELEGDLFLSIHLNQFRKSSVSGWEIHVPSTYTDSRLSRSVGQNPSEITNYVVPPEMEGDDAELKQLLWKQLQTHMEDYDFSGEWADVLAGELAKQREIPARGKRTTNKFVTGNLAMPSVLLEAGYLSSANDAHWIKNDRFRDRLATAIGNAVLKYLLGTETRLAEALPAGAAVSGRSSPGSRPSAVATPAATSKPSPAAPRKQTVHKLKKDETLSEIARKYGVSVTALLRANGLTPRGARRLQEGQTIKIP